MSEENERAKYLLQNWSHLQLAREYEKLENIIKEVREYINDDRLYMSNGNVLSIANTGCGQKILEILDKVDKE